MWLCVLGLTTKRNSSFIRSGFILFFKLTTFFFNIKEVLSFKMVTQLKFLFNLKEEENTVIFYQLFCVGSFMPNKNS